MKKSTKVVTLLLSALFAFGSASSLAACGVVGGKVQSAENEIVVKVRKAGFGTDWLYTLKRNFETAYKAEGYKVKILTPDNNIKDDVVIKELALGYQNVGVDLYITSGVMPDKVGVNGDYGVLVEDLADTVYSQKAINYQGEDEEKTVEEKMDPNLISYMTDLEGKKYAYCWAETSGGLVVNTTKLEQYGLEIPKTTKEMFECFEAIYCGNDKMGNSIKTGTYPITYVSGQNGYTLTFLHALLAQYDREYFDTLWSFQTKGENGEVIQLSDAECQDVYNDEAMYEMLKVAYRTFDMTIAAPGSQSQTVDQAQAKIMGNNRNGAVFMFNGDWMLNEVKLNYRNYLHNIDFVNYPVMSSIGTKLFGADTAYGLDEEACDALLSFIVDCVDENMEIDAIIQKVKAEKDITLAEADAKEVARARGLTYSRGVEHVAYVTKGTTKMDIVSKFLRMMSSDDYGETFNVQGNGATPYCAIENTTSEYKFVRNASKVTANRYFSFVSTINGARGYRGLLNFQRFFTTSSHLPFDIASNSRASLYTMDGTKKADANESVYADAAKEFQKNEVENIIKNWDKWLENAGLK